MGARWTAWHFFFGYLLRKRGPSAIELRDEVPLSAEPPRVDYLLVRKADAVGQTGSDDARTLRKLWPMLPRVSVVEYKSPSHPYRHAHLDRLWGYAHIHFANQQALPRTRATSGTKSRRRGLSAIWGTASPQRRPRGTSGAVSPSGSHVGSEGSPDVRGREDLCAVLIVASRTPGLDGDIASMGLRWEDCGDGYWRVHGGLFALYVVEIDVVGPAEDDELLYSLGHGKATTPAAARFWLELAGSKEAPMSVEEMEGYAELMHKMLDTLSPEEVLSHYKPEQRLSGLDRDHVALALPIDVLRALSDEYLQTLSPEVQAKIRRRIGRNGQSRTPSKGR